MVRAARHGLPVIFAIIGGNRVHFKSLFDYYRKAYEHFNHDPKTLQVGVHLHSFFSDDSRQIADEYYLLYAAQMNRVGRQRGWPPYSINDMSKAGANKVTY